MKSKTPLEIAARNRQRRDEIIELLKDADKFELFRSWCFLCFQIRSSKSVRKPGGFWQEVEIYALAPIGFFFWLDFKIQKWLGNV